MECDTLESVGRLQAAGFIPSPETITAPTRKCSSTSSFGSAETYETHETHATYTTHGTNETHETHETHDTHGYEQVSGPKVIGPLQSRGQVIGSVDGSQRRFSCNSSKFGALEEDYQSSSRICDQNRSMLTGTSSNLDEDQSFAGAI